MCMTNTCLINRLIPTINYHPFPKSQQSTQRAQLPFVFLIFFSARLFHYTCFGLKVHQQHQARTVTDLPHHLQWLMQNPAPPQPYPNLLHFPLRQNIRNS